jgi:hypothetical protein
LVFFFLPILGLSEVYLCYLSPLARWRLMVADVDRGTHLSPQRFSAE